MTAPSDGLKVSGRIRTRSHLRLLAAYARLYVLWSFAGRTWTLTLVANRLVPPLIGLAVWRAALPGRWSATSGSTGARVLRCGWVTGSPGRVGPR